MYYITHKTYKVIIQLCYVLVTTEDHTADIRVDTREDTEVDTREDTREDTEADTRVDTEADTREDTSATADTKLDRQLLNH